MKTCLIKQPIGLGDVFYLQKFAHIIKAKGYNILWPLRDDIFWISEYLSGIDFCKLSDDFFHKDIYYSGHFSYEENDFLFLSPDGYQSAGRRIMESKYHLINEDDSNWYDYFNFNRKIDKEENLFYNILNLSKDQNYIFINKMASIDIRYSNVLDNFSFAERVVELSIINGFNLFDWSMVLENAYEIHTVHTGANYVIDKLSIKAVVYNMYQGLHHSDVQYIPFCKNPKFIPN